MATTADKKITDPEVIEQIRSAMPEAGVNEKGLMSPTQVSLLKNSPFNNTYTETTSQIDTYGCDGLGIARDVPLGAFYIIPTSDCSLYGKGDGLLCTIRRSFLTQQTFYSRDGSIFVRCSNNFNNFGDWKHINLL